MKTKRIVAILCVLALAFAAISLCACVDSPKEEDIETLMKKCNKSLWLEGRDESTIRISTDVYSVYVTTNNGSKLGVSYVSDPNFAVNAEVTTDELISSLYSNVLKVTELSVNPLAIFTKRLYMIVSVPESWTRCRLEITTEVGKVQVDDVKLFNAEISTDTGSVLVEDCNLSSLLDIQTATGSVKVDADAQKLVVNSDTGRVETDGKYVDVDVKTDTGSISLNCEANSVKAVADTGSISMDVTAWKLYLETSTGSIRGKVEGYKHFYTIRAESETGSCNLQNTENGDGEHVLEAHSDTGSIRISFDAD